LIVNPTSNWPLPSAGRRLLTPASLLHQLARHPLSRGCYATAVGFYPNAEGHEMRRSAPQDHLLIFCTEGVGQVLLGSERFRIGSGDLMLLPPRVAHSYRAAKKYPWTIYWVHFAGDEARDFAIWLRKRGADPLLHCGVDPRLLGGFQQLLDSLVIGAGLDLHISAANRLRQLLTTLGARRVQTSRDERIGDIDLLSLQRYMRERIATRLNLDQLAALAHLSPQHFATRYRDRSGYAPMQHFQHMKIEAACRLLDSTDDSVKSIAASVGFSDPLYFSRVFRRAMGLSPTAYRHSQRR